VIMGDGVRFYFGVAMMVVAVAVFVLLMPRGGEPRIKSDSGQAFGVMALILLFILGAILAVGVH